MIALSQANRSREYEKSPSIVTKHSTTVGMNLACSILLNSAGKLVLGNLSISPLHCVVFSQTLKCIHGA